MSAMIVGGQRGPPMNLDNAINLYLAYNYTLAEKTRLIYSEHLARLTPLAAKQVHRISHHDLRVALSTQKKANGTDSYAPGTVDQIWRTWNAFFNFLLDEQLITVNPMARVPRPTQAKGTKARLSLSQVKKLIATIKATDTRRFDMVNRNLAMVLLMVDSGLRLNEVVGLRIGDLDADEFIVRVYDHKTRKFREIPIGDQCYHAIERWLTQRLAAKSVKEPLFLTADGNPITQRALHLLMKRLEKRAGFPLHCHLLRHTFGNIYIKRGDIRKLQKIMGHSRIDTTARFYTDPDLPDIQAEHRRASPMAQIDES